MDLATLFASMTTRVSLQWFFTFADYAYNERYAKAAKAQMEALLDKTKDDTEAWHTMRSIEASEPNGIFRTTAVCPL